MFLSIDIEMRSTFFSNLIRKKPEDQWRRNEGPLLRCLTTFSLAMIGFGSVLGTGIYVIIGNLARNVAGPAIVISFFLACIAVLLSGLCYAEFSSRIPKARTVYAYTYIALGEIWAFVVGWNAIMEYFTIAAVLARSCSGIMDALADGKIFKFSTESVATWNVSFLPTFPDFLAVSLVVGCTFIVCLGMKQSYIFIRFTFFINVIVVAFIITTGTYYSLGSQTWSTEKKFLPYGWSGVLKAGARAIFCFVGISQITAASEDVLNPSRALPGALILTMLFGFLAYVAVSTVLTLMIPYSKLTQFAPIAEAFKILGLEAGKYVIIVAALTSIISNLMSAMLVLPEIISSMAADGLLFKILASVNERTKIPIVAAITSGIIVSLLTLFLDIGQLIEMLSIGTLSAYTLLAIAVVVSRYDPRVTSVNMSSDSTRDFQSKQNWWSDLCQRCNQSDFISVRNDGYEAIHSETSDPLPTLTEKGSNTNSEDLRGTPTDSSSLMVRLAISCTTTSLTGLLVTLTKCWDYLTHGEPWAIIFVFLFVLLILFSLVVLSMQPKNSARFPYMVPCVPILPVISIAINLLLLVNLAFWSFVIVAAWLVAGKFHPRVIR